MNRPLSASATLVVVMLCFSWALQQIAVKLALPEIGPLTQGASRSVGAALIVALYLATRRHLWIPGLGVLGMLAGLLFGAEFLMLYKALELTDAARATMFLYTAPFVVAIGSHFFLSWERLDLKSWVGIGLAFIGVALALRPSAVATEQAWIGDLMALAAAIFWGLTTLLIKGTRLRECTAAQILFYQLAVCAVMFLIAVGASDEALSVPLSGISIVSLLYQTLWVASVSYMIWFVMIRRYSPTSISVVTFVTPLFGVALGVVLLGEPAALELLFGAVSVATGIFLVSLPRKPNRA